MLTKRQNEILKIIVLEYIKLAKPVSSNLICDELNCSSATVRSEMASLEELGLLEKTHTSSGRIPSEAGYRYYVDNLMELKKMSAEDMLKLQIIFKNNQLELNDCIKKSLEIVSDITNCTSIKLGKTSHENNLKEIQVVPLDSDNMIVIVITDRGYVEHKRINVSNISSDEIKKTVDLINNMISGTPIDEVGAKLEFEVKPIIGRYVKEHERLYNVFYNVFTNFTNKNVDIVGRRNMLKQPEFNDINKVSKIFDKFEDDDLINTVEAQDNNIKIPALIRKFHNAKENNLDEDMTIIKTKYKTPIEEGTIAIIGPKRMEYDRVVQLLEFIKENIER